jgi:hypothetical protein
MHSAALGAWASRLVVKKREARGGKDYRRSMTVTTFLEAARLHCENMSLEPVFSKGVQGSGKVAKARVNR